MRRFLILITTILSLSVHAQDGAMEGIDAYFLEEGYYDNLSDALTDKEGTLYLDLSLQSPKLQKIPKEVYSLNNLVYLELGFNQINAVDDGIGKLEKLEVLGLDGNKYLKSISAEMYSLLYLKELHVKETGLTSDYLDAIQSNLRTDCKLIK